MKYGYFFYVIIGFLSGSILFGRLIPMIFRGVDVRDKSLRMEIRERLMHLPRGGAFCGILVLLADLGKGAIPVALCAKDLGINSWMFALVMAAPVFGHAHSLFQKGHGGKAIAVSFGVLIGLLPLWRPLAALIFWYLLFIIVIPARSNTRKSVYTFLAFAVTVMLTVPYRTVLSGCILMSGIVIHKHCLKANAAYRRGEEWRLE